MPKYKCIETIPARVFFEILESKNYQLLRPKPKEEGLEVVFADIYDKWFEKSDNSESKAYLETHKEIMFLEYKTLILKNVLAFLYGNRLTEPMFDEIVEALRVGYGIDFDKREDIFDEVKRVLNVHVGDMNLELMMLKDGLKSDGDKGEKVKFDFYAVKATIENALMRTLDRDMVLAEWIAIENSVRKLKH